MPYIRKVKRVVRRVAKKGLRLAKRRYYRGNKLNVRQIGKDVAMLKAMVNAEKKRITVSNNAVLLGQVNANNSGHILFDITPVIAQGTDYNQRTGASVKWHSSYFDMNFVGQASMTSGMKIQIQIVKVVGQVYSPISGVLDKFVLPTRFLSGTNDIYDVNSDRQPDYFKQFRVLRTLTTYIKPDTISGETALRRIKFGVKYPNHHIKNEFGTATLADGQVFMMITADRGNSSSTACTLTDPVPIKTAQTGVSMAYELTHYYYDN